MSSSPYGKKGGESPNSGKIARKYRIALPDGTILTKRTFATCPSGPIVATASRRRSGGVFVAVWPEGTPIWEGDFGRLIAEPVE